MPPNKVIDVQALAGDSTDNVPGVPGIGIKTAAELINTYGDLETLLKRAGEIKQTKRRENLIEHAEMARISKKLVTLDHKAPVPVPLSEFGVIEPDPRELVGFLKAMEFATLMKRVAAEWDLSDAGFDSRRNARCCRAEGGKRVRKRRRSFPRTSRARSSIATRF